MESASAAAPSQARAEEVAAAATELEAAGRLGLTRGFIQHGSVTVYDHVCAVARASLAVADALSRVGVRVARDELLRGALLHDYFLYDWHEKEAWHRFHGLRHPFFARANAEQDFPDLTARERNIIERHMFPLVVLPPTCREAWIVCLADKAVALRETLFQRDGAAAGPTAASRSAAAARATARGAAVEPPREGLS